MLFRSNRNNVVPNDDDFVFFSNPVSSCSSIRIQPSNQGEISNIDIDLRTVPEHVEKITIAYSIYANSTRDNFSRVTDPFVAIRSNGKIKYVFVAPDLMMETTAIFIEFYRYNGSWAMGMIGSGYKYGLSNLCEGFGLMVGY